MIKFNAQLIYESIDPLSSEYEGSPGIDGVILGPLTINGVKYNELCGLVKIVNKQTLKFALLQYADFIEYNKPNKKKKLMNYITNNIDSLYEMFKKSAKLEFERKIDIFNDLGEQLDRNEISSIEVNYDIHRNAVYIESIVADGCPYNSNGMLMFHNNRNKIIPIIDIGDVKKVIINILRDYYDTTKIDKVISDQSDDLENKLMLFKKRHGIND